MSDRYDIRGNVEPSFQMFLPCEPMFATDHEAMTLGRMVLQAAYTMGLRRDDQFLVILAKPWTYLEER